MSSPNYAETVDALIDLIEFFRDGHSTTSREVATRYGVSLRTAERWCQRVKRWVPLQERKGFRQEIHYRIEPL